jgi:hypothetical protein
MGSHRCCAWLILLWLFCNKRYLRVSKQAIEKETALVDSLKEELTGLLAVIDNMSISEITNLRDSLRNGDGWFGSSQD